MSNKQIALLLACAAITIAVGIKIENHHQKMLVMAEMAYMTGCYNSAKIACGHLYTEKDLYNCYDDALVYCPKDGKAFRDWIANGKK